MPIMPMAFPEQRTHQHEIVIASSNIFRRELSCYILSEAGYHVREATSRSALCAYLNQAQPDLILLDHRLPGLDTLLVRDLHQRSEVPLIFLTDRGRPAESLASATTTRYSTIEWPFQADDLCNQVYALLMQPSPLLTLRYQHQMA